jgi:hypothetical protein
MQCKSTRQGVAMDVDYCSFSSRSNYNGHSFIRICSSYALCSRRFIYRPMSCWRLWIGCRPQTLSKASISTSHVCVRLLTSTRSACSCDFKKCTSDCCRLEKRTTRRGQKGQALSRLMVGLSFVVGEFAASVNKRKTRDHSSPIVKGVKCLSSPPTFQ